MLTIEQQHRIVTDSIDTFLTRLYDEGVNEYYMHDLERVRDTFVVMLTEAKQMIDLNEHHANEP